VKIDIRSEGATKVIALAGHLGGALTQADRSRIQALIQPGAQLALDFTDVQEISGVGLRQLLLLTRQVRSLGGAIVVTGASAHLREIAAASGFGDLFGRSTPLPISNVGQTPRERIDLYPTHSSGDFALRPGMPRPLGATVLSRAINFAVYSRHGTQCTLVLFEPGAAEPFAEIPFLPEFRVGDIHAMMVFDLDPEAIEYAFRMEGPFAPREGHRFDGDKELLDPTARAVSWRPTWGRKDESLATPRGHLIPQDFDWEDDHPLELPLEELVIYEMHVRGFTRHPSSEVAFPGTYAGLREKIPYLVELGVNCVELLPIFEFDETEPDRINPVTGEPLVNYWGYSTLGFYAPKAAYAATGPFQLQADEFKTLVKDLHRHGIEVMLDVVFNHTAEGNEQGPTLSFRGLDNSTYYMLTPDGGYYNFSGCGNTFNCNHPVVREFVLDCLRYWVAEYHVDGFRFDLASILDRAPDGTPLANPPLLESLALDPILGRTKLIAEAWDAGGLYQVGHFPAYGRWAEWNGKYRDCVRKFLKGDAGQVSEMSLRLSGSPDLYARRGPTASINFVTCHDGFTLADVVSYNDKHNEANGEQNRDGSNDNDSWNCGVEGPTEDPAILSLRQRLMKNALAMLFLSQGVPMLLMGDEIGRSQQGNNNAYCQDNELSWLDWSLKTRHAELFRFCQALISFRKAHPVLRRSQYSAAERGASDKFEIGWHGTQPWRADLSGASRVLAFHARLRREGVDDLIYAAFNSYWETLDFDLPPADDNRQWHLFANTGVESPHDVCLPGHERPLKDPHRIHVAGRSVVILVAR
jgi:glycogen operon protein